MTITLDEPRTIRRFSLAHPTERVDTPCGAAAAVLVCGWMFAADRRVDPHYAWTSVAGALTIVMLSRPIARRGLFRRACIVVVQITAALTVLFTANRALSGWAERAPRFGSASTVASTVLNLVGYHTAAERGLLVIDHPEGLVTIVPSMEKLALVPLLLLWLAWIALRLVRGHRDLFVPSIVGLGATLLVAIARYVVLLAVYVEHDGILSTGTGQAALDLFTSPWITCFFLILAGIAADRSIRLLAHGAAALSAPPPCPDGRRVGSCHRPGRRRGGLCRLLRPGRDREVRPDLDRRPVLWHLGTDGAAA